MTNAPEIFNSSGCVQVNNFVDTETIKTISQYLENKLIRGEWTTATGDTTTELCYYADPLIEVMLLKCKDAVENVCGKELIPTYSYARIYQPGEDLRPHLDRPACEVSVTVNVANKGPLSPIYMQYQGNAVSEHTLNPGDAVIYQGCTATHWRLPMKDDQLTVQFMLHYVDKNGPNADHAKDKRPSYAAPLESKEGV